MSSKNLEPEEIYVFKMKEVSERLGACEAFLSDYNRRKNIYFLESAILQLRKALESISLAAIAPNKKAYEKLRSEAEKPANYRKDYKGRKTAKMEGSKETESAEGEKGDVEGGEVCAEAEGAEGGGGGESGGE